MKPASAFLLLLAAASTNAHEPDSAAPHPDHSTNYVMKLEQLEHINAAPGESIHLMRGDAHGFDSLSVILTDTQPCGGPPIHTHETEEAHVLYEGCAVYLIGADRFTVHGPYVARVPAGVPHTFMNCGKEPLRLTAVFPSAHYTFSFVEESPLCQVKRK
ncbi:MAG: cupin domain-containing protein [Gammaproteobacteria bacterium]